MGKRREDESYMFLGLLLEVHQDDGRHGEERRPGEGDLGAAGGHGSQARRWEGDAVYVDSTVPECYIILVSGVRVSAVCVEGALGRDGSTIEVSKRKREKEVEPSSYRTIPAGSPIAGRSKIGTRPGKNPCRWRRAGARLPSHTTAIIAWHPVAVVVLNRPTLPSSISDDDDGTRANPTKNATPKRLPTRYKIRPQERQRERAGEPNEQKHANPTWCAKQRLPNSL